MALRAGGQTLDLLRADDDGFQTTTTTAQAKVEMAVSQQLLDVLEDPGSIRKYVWVRHLSQRR